LYEVGNSSREYLKYIIIGSLVLIAGVLPFTAHILRYQLGAFFRTLINTIGVFSLVIGGILTALGFFSIFTKRFMLGSLITGILLLWVGMWLTGFSIEIFGFTLGGNSPTNDPGYH
jgi:hypothetical protein